MACKWCQNPEGMRSDRQPVWMEHHCIHCGECWKNAREGQMEWNNHSPVIHRDWKGSFDNLIQACPTGALRMDSRTYTVEELMTELKKDQVFYRYGGGVTFSGGEPFLQKEFLLSCLKECHQAGISTAVETALHVDGDAVKEALPYLDEIFADCKHMDSSIHKAFTGVNNELILENLRWLLKHAKIPVTIRTPLIPGYNATPEVIASIAGFLAECSPTVHYELLNYNELAPAKYPMVERDYEPGIRHRFNEAEMESFKEIALAQGLNNVTI